MTDGDARGPQSDKTTLVKRLLPLLVLAGVAALVISQGWHKYLTLEQIAANRDLLKGYIADNYLGALLAYMGIYIVVIALSLPGGVFLTLTGGFLFGWLVGGISTVIAATIGATIIFLIAKTSLGEPLAERAGPRLDKLRAGFQDSALNYLLFLRLVPLFPFWLVNLAPALLGVGLGTYIIGTFFGIIPGTFAFSYAGVGLDSVIEAQQQAFQDCLKGQTSGAKECEFSLDPGALVTSELLIAFAALGVVALIPVILKKFRKSASAS
ncbi:TVP38/TMEM64 family inner membrane protein YdjZ [bacterium BMS3Bbin10]|nr:TVP38/TMEM64 family inner membrane protein YdjZ [bacterium BMS3Bbin10]